MNRAKQTAETISKKIKIKPKIEKSLNEFKSDMLIKNKNKWMKVEKGHYNKLISFLKKIIQFRQTESGVNSIYWFEKFKNWRLKIWKDNNHLSGKLKYNKFSYFF